MYNTVPMWMQSKYSMVVYDNDSGQNLALEYAPSHTISVKKKKIMQFFSACSVFWFPDKEKSIFIIYLSYSTVRLKHFNVNTDIYIMMK